jgi:hypothetical protein
MVIRIPEHFVSGLSCPKCHRIARLKLITLCVSQLFDFCECERTFEENIRETHEFAEVVSLINTEKQYTSGF